MKKLLILFLFSFVVMGAKPVLAGEAFAIAATVNKDAISESDVNERMQLVFASSGVQNNAANRKKARPQALNSLIDEQLKLQEAARQNLQITPEDISGGFQTIAASNKLTPEEFSEIMRRQGIPKSTLLAQIKAQIAWSKVIQSVLRPQVDVSENDINAKLERIKANIGKVEYQASEIYLPVTSPDQEAPTKELALKLIEEIKSGRAPFELVAQQFSKAAGAENGGSMGWVQEGQLPNELDLVLKSLNEGQISPPVRGLSGFHIITVVTKRSVSGDTLPTQDEVLSSIGLERLDRLQQRYLSDIRSAAFIDRRD